MMLRLTNESDVGPGLEDQIDLLIGAVGYETRSSWLLRNIQIQPRSIIGLRFHYSEVLHFRAALKLYQQAGASIVSFQADADWMELIPYFQEALKRQESPVSVAIDISAMSRTMLASVVLALTQCHSGGLRLFIHYGPAKFSRPLETMGMTVAQPIVSELAGWSCRPDFETAAVVGLGFENGLALGALQHVEPTRAWLFEPHGFDRQFVAEVRRANGYIDSVFEARTIPYKIDRPTETRASIGALMRDLRETHRIVFIPFGPKIFSWLCILSALEDPSRESSVWRFSAQENRPPIDFKPSGHSIWHQVLIQHPDFEPQV
ncbi:MAG TPA: hypothetical protein VHS33_08145 [Sphingomicrobium sp.]|jgi:hypothetical protein|nr:hypothetical protein [Sphingomicrobium sp.]